MLWILRSGARWQDLPERFPPYQTCHRRYQGWVRSGALRDILEVLAEDLRERGQIDLSECFIDGTFIVAKKGGQPWVPPSGAKARSSWLWQTLLVFLSPPTQRVLARLKSPLSKQLWKRVSLLNNPPRLIGDKAYDSDPLDAQLAEQGIEMIAPHRRGRKKPATQDGRVLRRYRRRWKVERLNRLAAELPAHPHPPRVSQPKTTSASSTSAASRFCCASIYETASNQSRSALERS